MLCFSCFSNLPLTNFNQYPDNPVEKVFWGRLPVFACASYLYFNKHSLVQSLIHQLKYKGNRDIGHYLGTKLGESVLGSGRFMDLDALVPLPLHPRKMRKRGYNQATILCEAMAEVLRIPVIDNAVTRGSATETQTRKSRLERWQNMEGKFKLADPPLLKNKNILLVDDIITTGATLEACGQELLKIPGLALGIATLAYTSV
jgi:ComF family protein